MHPLTDTEVYQETHYYPFGMTMEGEWQNIVNGPENNYLYNGKELNSDFGLDWSDYGARYYDAAIGRWNRVDPKAEGAYGHSPYNSMFNNPVSYSDPDGDFAFVPILIGAAIGAGIGGVTNGWEGAWKGALTGAVGGALGQFGGGSLLNDIAWGRLKVESQEELEQS